MIRADRIATGLARPTFAASAPGDPDRLYITEKDTGRVVLFDPSTGVRSVFFDIPASEMTISGSRGLLGLAFHPQFEENGKVYLSLTNELGNSEVAELSGGVMRTILEIPRTSPIHVAGWIGFGPDGLLYVPTGDSGGADGGDPENAAQDTGDLRGKLLRLDVDAGAPPEMFAVGLRNPWRASFDRATGDLYIGNVGQFEREEIEYLPAGTPAGTNFGWRVMEGSLATGYPQDGNPAAFDPGFRAPVLEYAHGTGEFEGRSVTGGYVYRGPGGEQGQYFFADFRSNNLWSMRVENGQALDWRNRDAELEVSGGTFDQIASFAEDGQGRLYAIGLDGEIFRFTMQAATPAEERGISTSHGDSDDEMLEFAVMVGAAAILGAWFF